MLIEFSVGNFRSFKSNVTLSMVAAKISAKDKHVDENNTYLADNDLILLTSAAIYGANASGKSNLITAIAFMKNFVLNSSRETQASESINVENFRLSTETSDKPSFFQVVFLMGEKKYRYGFEVDRGKVVTEWLFIAGSRKEIRLFSRDEEGISLARIFKEGKGLQDKTRPNALYISVVSQFNGLISKNVLDWFRNLRIVSGLDDVGYRGFTLDRFEEESVRQDIIRLVKSLDLGIDDITSKKMEQSEVNLPADFPKELKELIFKNPSNWFLIQTQHKKYDANGKSVDIEVFDLESNESHGTQKLFFLAGPLLDTLVNGRVLFIDELEARLHPNLTCEIIKLFNSKETNKNHSQLIFTTHDTNLLSNKMFRRDQIYFTEKDRKGSTHLYSLSELKVRNDAFYENDYIEGKYGAIPFIGDLRRIILEEEK